MRRQLFCGLLAVTVAYLAGVWNGLTDSWWVTGAASLLMLVATLLIVVGAAIREKRDAR